jgi:multicomponent Na+:H+ antiporter subunit D
MILPYFVITPLFAAFLITLIAGKKDIWGITISIATEAVMLVLALYSFITYQGQILVYEMGARKVPYGICLVQDSLTCFMMITVSLISLTSLIYSIQYIRHLDSTWRFYTLFMLLVSGMNGVIMTGDLFNLFVFMEIALLSAFALVAYGAQAEEFEASFKYAIMGGISSSVILIGIAIIYSSTSALTMAKIAQQIPFINIKLMYWIGGLFLAGFFLKAAAVPFHAWLPDAHSSAPAPISSMLSGVFIKVLGVYALIRIVYIIFGAPAVFLKAFLVFGAVSILIGGLLSINQWDMKRLLAYSSISQVGYILLGLGLATPLGILGALYHLFNHAIMKSLLFYNAGSAEMAVGTRDIRKMGNLTKLLPVTSSTSLIGSMAISGIPPFNGFFSKLIIIIAAIQAHTAGYAIVAIIGSLLTLAALLKVQRYGFRGLVKFEKPLTRISWSMKSVMIVLALLCLLTSLMIVPGIKEVTLDPVVAAITDQTRYIQTVMGR